jgi:hypothetical protein
VGSLSEKSMVCSVRVISSTMTLLKVSRSMYSEKTEGLEKWLEWEVSGFMWYRVSWTGTATGLLDSRHQENSNAGKVGVSGENTVCGSHVSHGHSEILTNVSFAVPP